MNPVKAGISKKEEDYNFSSYKEYLNLTGIINSKIIDIVFNSKEEYLKKFNSIQYEPINLEKEEINIKDILEKFMSKRDLKLYQIQKSEILIKQFISYLISSEYKFTKQDIAKVLKISRASLYRKLNKGSDSK